MPDASAVWLLMDSGQGRIVILTGDAGRISLA
jgi:hypothetical protein